MERLRSVCRILALRSFWLSTKGRVVGFVELPFHIREGRRQIIRVLWVESRTETVEAVPVDVALGSFRVDVLTVGKVETAVIVLGVVSAVGSGSSVVSC